MAYRSARHTSLKLIAGLGREICQADGRVVKDAKDAERSLAWERVCVYTMECG